MGGRRGGEKKAWQVSTSCSMCSSCKIPFFSKLPAGSSHSGCSAKLIYPHFPTSERVRGLRRPGGPPPLLSLPARFLSHLGGDFLGKGFPGRAWVELPGTALGVWLPGRLSRGDPCWPPLPPGPGQDSHRALLPRRVSQRPRHSYGRGTSGCLTGFVALTCPSVSGDLHMYTCVGMRVYLSQ